MSEVNGKQSYFREVVEFALHKDIDDAIAEQLAWIEQEPSNPKPYCALGTFFHMQGRLEDAILMYRRALQLDPNFALAHQYLGQLLAARGELEFAWHHAREAARRGNRVLLGILERLDKNGSGSPKT